MPSYRGLRLGSVLFLVCWASISPLCLAQTNRTSTVNLGPNIAKLVETLKNFQDAAKASAGVGTVLPDLTSLGSGQFLSSLSSSALGGLTNGLTGGLLSGSPFANFPGLGSGFTDLTSLTNPFSLASQFRASGGTLDPALSALIDGQVSDPAAAAEAAAILGIISQVFNTVSGIVYTVSGGLGTASSSIGLAVASYAVVAGPIGLYFSYDSFFSTLLQDAQGNVDKALTRWAENLTRVANILGNIRQGTLLNDVRDLRAQLARTRDLLTAARSRFTGLAAATPSPSPSPSS